MHAQSVPTGLNHSPLPIPSNIQFTFNNQYLSTYLLLSESLPSPSNDARHKCSLSEQLQPNILLLHINYMLCLIILISYPYPLHFIPVGPPYEVFQY